MGKIKKQFSEEKHGSTLSSYVAEFIRTAQSLPLYKLRSHLATFPQRWVFPRGDLYHWIALLNRFDDILEHFNKIYALDQGPQTKPFGRELLTSNDPKLVGGKAEPPSDTTLYEAGYSIDGDRELVQDILSFTRLLHENCGNRTLYASSARLNDILNTSSLSLLEVTLRLLQRLAQRYASQRIRGGHGSPYLGAIRQDILATYYNVDLEKLETLAGPALREETVPRIAEWLQTGKPEGTQGFKTSQPDEALDEGFENLLTSQKHGPDSVAQDLARQRAMDFASNQQDPSQTKQSFYAQYDGIRTLQGVLGGPEGTASNATIRLLAIANLAQIYPEATLQAKALKVFSEKPRHRQMPHILCELIRPPSSRSMKVPRQIQTLAVLTLESFTIHKNLGNEVCTALNVSVNHGPLASALRQAVNLITDPEGEEMSSEDSEWLKELFDLFQDLPKTGARAVEGIVSAGLIEMLVEILKAKSPKAEKTHDATLRFLGTYVWNIQDAIGSLVNAGGLDVMSELLVHHIERAITLTRDGNGMLPEYKTQATDYLIPFVQQQSLRAIFKFVHNMLSMSHGHFDRLMRNLLEASDVLASLRTVINHPKLFGSNVWTNCVHVFSSFINNEPTSYTAIAEAGIPRAILESIVQRSLLEEQGQAAQQTGESMQDVSATVSELPSKSSAPSATGSAGGVLPACEAVNAVPDAFGAMCLNEAGFQQFEKSNALETLFGVFVSPAHVRAFHTAVGSDVDRLGASVEQLHRHNPSISAKIKDLVISTADRVAALVASAPLSGLIPDDTPKDTDRLARVTLSEDVEMRDAQSSPTTSINGEDNQLATPVSTYVSVFTKFLASIFRNTSFCSHFTEKGGLHSLMTMASAPGLFKDHEPSKGISLSSLQKFGDVIRHMIEQKPFLVLPSLIGHLQSHLNKMSPLLAHTSESSFMLPLTKFDRSSQLDAVTKSQHETVLRSLVQVQLLAHSLGKGLSPVHPHGGPRHHPPQSPLTQVSVADMLCPLIDSLSQLQTKMLWEQQLFLQTPKPGGPRQPSDGANTQVSGAPGSSVTSIPSPSEQPAQPNQPVPGDETSGDNSKADTDIAYLATNYQFILPSTITDLLGKIVNTMVPRRLNTDNYQRQQVLKIGERIAQAAVNLLSFQFPDNTDQSTILRFRKAGLDCVWWCLLGKRVEREAGRSPIEQLQSVVAIPFMKKGGIEMLGSHAQNAMQLDVRSKGEDEDDNRYKRRRHEAMTVLVKIVDLLAPMTEKRSVAESTHSAAMASRDRSEPGTADYFSGSQLLVETRLSVLRAISPIWTSEQLPELQSAIVRGLSKVVKSILEGSGEGGAMHRTDRLPKARQTTHKTWVARSGQLRSLTESGFARDLAEEALYRCNDTEATAREYCIYHENREPQARHAPPSEDVQQPSPPAEASPEQLPPAPSSEHSDPPREDEEMSSTPSMNPEDIAREIQGSLDAEPSDQPPAPLLDALSQVATGILQDPSNTAHPSGSGPLDQPDIQDPDSNRERVNADEVTDLLTIEDLSEERQQLRDDLMDRCLKLSGVYEDVTFEISDLIVASIHKADDPSEMRREVSATLVLSLVSYTGNENLKAEGKKISGIAHLLGIVLQDREFFEAAQEELKSSFSSLISLLPIAQGQKPSEDAPWIPQVLLILERVLVEDIQPHQIQWTPPPMDDPLKEQPIASLPEPMTTQDDKIELFKVILDLLPAVGKELELGTALVRVLVLLTRARNVATTLAQKHHMQRFLVLIKQLAPSMNDRFRGSVLLILRHIIEDEETVRRLIRSDIKELLERPQRTDTTRFCKELYHDVLRSPDLFVEVTSEICEVSRSDRQPNPAGPQTIILKKPSESTPETQTAEATASEEPSSKAATEKGVLPSAESDEVDEKPKAQDIKPPVVEKPDGVIHHLLSQLLTYKDVEDKKAEEPATKQNTEKNGDVEMTTGQAPATGQSYAPSGPETTSSSQKEQFKAGEHPIYVYRCFLLQALTELLGSYNRSKVEFINFSRKADPQAATPSKPRSGILNYLLNALLPTGSIEHATDIVGKKKAQTSNYAIGAVVALCSRTPEHGPVKKRDTTSAEDEPELAFVRKFVLEHALKAYKDCMSSFEPIGAKYSRLLALADLFNRMLAGRLTDRAPYRRGHSPEDNLEASNKHIARIMFDKNFSGALTASLAEIDPKFQPASRLIKYVLRPLKLLTQTAIDLSMSGETASQGATTEEDEISSASSGSEADEGREETPDLFRHSTLGMFDPDRVQDHSSSESEGEEDEMYDDGYGDGIEYDEEDEDANEGDVVSDEDEEMGDAGPMEGLDGDVGVDVEIDLEGDSGSDDEDEDDEGEDDEMDDDDDDDGEDIEEDTEHDHDDDEESDVQILDEITGDNENDSLGDGPEDYQQQEDMQGMGEPGFDMLHPPPSFPMDEDPSDVEVETYGESGIEAHLPHEHLALDMDPGEGPMPVDLESEGDEEDDEDDYDEELMYQEPEDADTEMPPYIFNTWPTMAGRRGPRPSAYARDPDADPDSMFDDGYSPRGHGPRNEPTDGQNPLLNRTSRLYQSATGRPSMFPPSAHSPLAHLLPRLSDLSTGRPHDFEHYHQLTSLINAIGRGGPQAILPALQGHHHHHHHPGEPMTFRLAGSGASHDFMEIQVQPPPAHGLPMPNMNRSHATTHSDPARAVAFEPSLTAGRWQEEARLIFGSQFSDKALKVVNSIHKKLVPPAMEAEKQRKEKEAGLRKKAEEEQQRLETERQEREEVERKEREEREEREARERAEAEAAAAAERELEAESNESQEAPNDSMEGVERPGENEEAQPFDAQQPVGSSSERVTTNIRGSELDITDLGIDATYLEALPEEMREEVIMQQYTEHRSQAAAAGNEPSAVDDQFLQALPEDLREELLAAERQDRRRRERQEQRRQAAAAAGQPAQAEEMDPASFMASLDPALRQQVLAEADDEMLASLPAHMMEEARALSGHQRRRALDPTRLMQDIDHLTGIGPGRDRRQHTGEAQRQRRPIVQMLDKASVNTLLRLMFLTVPSNARQNLHGILRNACGNHQTRIEVVSGLLQILQEGSADQSAVEKSFSQTTNRAKQSTANKTPVKKTQANDNQLQSEAIPRLVIENCLGSLILLTQSIPHIPKFFLTEHELVVGSKSKNKGKGKARDSRAPRIPLNALLSLLDRELVVNDARLVEQLAGLLQCVTQPLVQLLKKEKEDATKEGAKAKHDESVQAPEVSTEAAASTETRQDSGSQASEAQQSTDAGAQTTQAGAAQPSADAPAEESANADEPKIAASKPDTKKAFEPPEVPEENLRLIINLMTARDCGGKTFRDALSTINNLSTIPHARDVFGQELVSRAREFSTSIARDLTQLTSDFDKAGDAMEAQNMALSKFSPTGTDQSKLLRILTALDYLFVEVKNSPDKESTKEKAQSSAELISNLHEDPTFSKVWVELNHTLSAAHKILAQGQQSDKTFLNVATILLPLIESLMVVSKRLDLKDIRISDPSQKTSAPTTPAIESTMKQIFFKFTNDHRKILNDLVRQNPKLMSGTFAVLIKNSSVLEFDNKRNYFNRRLHHRTMDMRQYPHPSLGVSVRRDQVFTDSYRSLFFKKPEEMKYGKLNVRFHNEEGVDAGGVTREWFAVLSRQMFDANFALFNPVAADRTTFHPNPLSYINDEHLPYFQFIGRIIGKALYENRVLDCHFSRAVYKQLLGRFVSLKDMETIDLDYAKSLQWMLDNDITDIITETFSVTSDNFGVTEIIDLVPDGRNIPVTDENKQEYVRLVIEHKLTGSVREQLDAFLKGFHDIVPSELVAIFDEGELELLISGLPEIDISDWRSNTDYHNYNTNSPQIQWFWRAVRSFGKEERAKLLQFITGTGKVPLNGFKELEGMNGFTRFSIHKDFGDKDRLPSSHTCFNQLDLPEYDSYESLRKGLYTAMTTGGEYFGFA